MQGQELVGTTRNTLNHPEPQQDYELPQEILSDRVHVLAITSGKGGVGKTTTVVNLAIALSRAGRRVTVIDADFGLGNIDIMLGLTPEYTLEHVLRGRMDVEEVLVKGPAGIQILPASSGVNELAHLSNEQETNLFRAMASLSGMTDVILLDTAAGISDNVTQLLYSSHEVILVTSPEPTAVVDAYAIVKILSRHDPSKTARLLVNWARDAHSARSIYTQLAAAARRFLGKDLDFLGYVKKDDHVQKAVRSQRPVLEAFPECPASRCFQDIAQRMQAAPPHDGSRGMTEFLKKLLRETTPETAGKGRRTTC